MSKTMLLYKKFIEKKKRERRLTAFIHSKNIYWTLSMYQAQIYVGHVNEET